MKSKPLTYVLLVIVLILYYNLFFKVKNYLGSDSETDVVKPNRLQLNAFELKRDTFFLDLSYRDPFEESDIVPLLTPSDNLEKQNTIEIGKSSNNVLWSEIEYFGILKKTSSSAALGVVSIDGHKHQVRKGESLYDGIVIISLDKESIHIKYKKETKIFFR